MGDDLQTATERLAAARRVIALTGAGVSAESGVPTFRGKDGHWKKHRAEDLATPEAFERDPTMVWEWYNHRRRELLPLEPNAGHHALVTLEQRLGDRFLLISQNVDGLHQRAGSKRIETLHGDIWSTRCLKCGDIDRKQDHVFDQVPPQCEKCQGMLRPAIVWFGEYLPPEPIQRIDLFKRHPEPINVMLLVGTMAMIHYIQSWAIELKRAGATLIEINPDETMLSDSADIRLVGKSGEILPQLIAPST